MSGGQQNLFQSNQQTISTMNQQVNKFSPNSKQQSTPIGQYNTNFYSTLTPKSSFDSIGSFNGIPGSMSNSIANTLPSNMNSGGQSGIQGPPILSNSISTGTSNSSTSLVTGTSPWSSGSFGNFNIPQNQQSPSTRPSTSTMDYQENFNFNRLDLSFVNDTDYMNSNRRSSIDLSVQQPLQNQVFRRTNNATKSRLSGGSDGGQTHSSSGYSQLQLDPVVESEFRNMAKSLEEKESIISDLKLQLESLVTAVVISGGINDKGVEEVTSEMKMDATEIAHRVILRLKMLKDENESLGKMLAHGRAAKMEVELGLLRRKLDNLTIENEMLKGKASDFDNAEVETSVSGKGD